MDEDRAAELGKLRDDLVAQIRGRYGIDPQVSDALRAVPRHPFLPGLPPQQVYRDEAFVTKRDPNGLPISSSSQPAIMAIMLDQLAVAPGQRVLEIGTGTGYNAALLAHLAGPDGEVVTLDIDQDLVAGARSNLAAAGYPEVTVACADGADGFPAHAPYDRIIATVGVWDLAPAWLEQITRTGRIVVPLDLGGVQRSVAFERANGFWASRSVRACGFMRMRGAFAGPQQVWVLDRDTEQILTVGRSRTIDVDAIRHALAEAVTVEPAGVTVTTAEVFDSLALWLALHEPRWCTLYSTADPTSSPVPVWLPGSQGTVGIVDGGSLAVLGCRPNPEHPNALAAFGYGPNGGRLATILIRHIRAWEQLGRPRSDSWRIHAYPVSTARHELAEKLIIEKTHTRLALTWTP